MSNEELPNDPDPSHLDTPTDRVTINRLEVDQLDAWLDQIRERRLQTVRKLEAVAKIKADEVRLEAFLKFQRQYERAKRSLAKLDEAIVKTEEIVHKCRLLALAAELEVTQEEDEDATVD